MEVTIMTSLFAERDMDVDAAHFEYSVEVFSVQFLVFSLVLGLNINPFSNQIFLDLISYN